MLMKPEVFYAELPVPKVSQHIASWLPQQFLLLGGVRRFLALSSISLSLAICCKSRRCLLSRSCKTAIWFSISSTDIFSASSCLSYEKLLIDICKIFVLIIQAVALSRHMCNLQRLTASLFAVLLESLMACYTNLFVVFLLPFLPVSNCYDRGHKL